MMNVIISNPCTWEGREILKQSTSLMPPKSGLSNILLSDTVSEHISQKQSIKRWKRKLTSLLDCTGRRFTAATLHNDSCCDCSIFWRVRAAFQNSFILKKSLEQGWQSSECRNWCFSLRFMKNKLRIWLNCVPWSQTLTSNLACLCVYRLKSKFCRRSLVSSASYWEGYC